MNSTNTTPWILAAAIVTAAACTRDLPTEPSKPIGTDVRYAALGASDTIGIGASVSCLPIIACPNGTGYVQVAARRFQSEGRVVTLVNLGVPGAVLTPEIQALGNNLGRGIPSNVVQNERPFVPENATLITLFIGGNDANTIGAATDAGQGGANPTAFIQTQVQAFGSSLRTLIEDLRTRAPQARVVVLNLPNLAAMPYAAGYTLQQRRGLQQIAVGLSAQINTTTTLGAIIVDLMCDQMFYQGGALSGDGFHPNDTGYGHMATLVHAAATGATPSPKASCPAMTIY